MNKLLMFFSLLASFNSYAQLWEPVVESESKTVYSYDPSSVRRDGDIVTYWELVDYGTPLKSGNLIVASSKTLTIQDCANNKFKVSTLMDYDGHKGMGNIVNAELARITNWYQGTPESANEVMKQLVCKE